MLEAATKPAVQPVTSSPSAVKNNTKKEDGAKVEDSSRLSDQLVPDYAARVVINLWSSCDKPKQPPVQLWLPPCLRFPV